MAWGAGDWGRHRGDRRQPGVHPPRRGSLGLVQSVGFPVVDQGDEIHRGPAARFVDQVPPGVLQGAAGDGSEPTAYR